MYKRPATDSRRRGSWAAAAVAAAFLGPGTVTTCSLAGVRFGVELLWVLLASLLVLWVAQESCVRLGAAGRTSLSEALVREFPSGPGRWAMTLLVTLAIGVGCAAYQAGNLRGGAVGVRMSLELSEGKSFALVGVCAALCLAFARRLDVLIRLLAVLIGVMTVCFVAAAILARPDPVQLLRGLFVPGLPADRGAGTILQVAGLVGTTIVPYNLFLHTSLVRDRTDGPEDLGRERRQSVLFLGLGVLISMAVMVATSRFHGLEDAPSSLSDMGRSLASLGPAGPRVFALGLFAAGLSSALTAPVAAGLALQPLLGRLGAVRGLVPWTVMAAGLGCGAWLGSTPEQLILLAQVTNALMLPVALAFLWWIGRRTWLGPYRAGPVASVLGAGVVVCGVLLSLKTGWTLWNR